MKTVPCRTAGAGPWSKAVVFAVAWKRLHSNQWYQCNREFLALLKEGITTIELAGGLQNTLVKMLCRGIW
ncbi:hypothetical protein KCP73_17685 [Salmonella enterica subsp. enterica]|nr:hypothetical protein KCP73_17685 [Salmonella enterica subsp. enterica]